MSDFRPAALDALEDALEDLELGIAPEAGGPEVAQRLDEYREILQWTRHAMPLVEVTPGLLDGVLEEARTVAPVFSHSSGAEGAMPTASESTEPASWWKKLRGVFVIPVLAVAGSAALVLILVRPAAEQNAETTLARSEQAPAEVRSQVAEAKTGEGQPAGALQNGLADASLDEEQSRGRLRLSEGEGVERAAAAEAEPADDPAPATDRKPVVEEPPPPPASMPEQSKAKAKAKPSDKIFYDDGGQAEKKPSSGGAPGGGSAGPKKDAARDSAAPPPKTPPSSSDATKQEEQKTDDFADEWGAIATADKERRAGDCASANKRYKSLSTAVDRRVKARALAGLGLCASNEKSADDFFGKARKADPDIAGFIAHERGGPPQAEADQAESL